MKRQKSKRMTNSDVFSYLMEFLKWVGYIRTIWWLGKQIAHYVSRVFRKLVDVYDDRIIRYVEVSYIPEPEKVHDLFGIADLSYVFLAKNLYHDIFKNRLKEETQPFVRFKNHPWIQLILDI